MNGICKHAVSAFHSLKLCQLGPINGPNRSVIPFYVHATSNHGHQLWMEIKQFPPPVMDGNQFWKSGEEEQVKGDYNSGEDRHCRPPGNYHA